MAVYVIKTGADANIMAIAFYLAHCSVGKPTDRLDEDLLYKLFSINAELLIDHAWGWEPCTMADIKAYTQSHRILAFLCPW